LSGSTEGGGRAPQTDDEGEGNSSANEKSVTRVAKKTVLPGRDKTKEILAAKKNQNKASITKDRPHSRESEKPAVMSDQKGSRGPRGDE